MFQCCLRVHLGIFPHEATPLKTRKKNLSSYSPTTGTRQISAFSSPTSHNMLTSLISIISLLCRFMVLQSEVENSLVRFLKMRQRLTSLQALEGSRELENIFGVSDSSCNLKAEVQKTKVLMHWGLILRPLKSIRPFSLFIYKHAIYQLLLYILCLPSHTTFFASFCVRNHLTLSKL
uniref:Uncharacterized protein n=1 Tax=Chelydra serpentina TaxID=8475 RepID=A0A8C3TFN0_CHESE